MERVIYRPRAIQRRAERYTANVASMITWPDGTEPVTIENISAYGALLEGRSFPPINTRITLIAEGLEACGTVIWLGPDRCGIMLRSPIDPLRIADRPKHSMPADLPQPIEPPIYAQTSLVSLRNG